MGRTILKQDVGRPDNFIVRWISSTPPRTQSPTSLVDLRDRRCHRRSIVSNWLLSRCVNHLRSLVYDRGRQPPSQGPRGWPFLNPEGVPHSVEHTLRLGLLGVTQTRIQLREKLALLWSEVLGNFND